MRSWTIKKAECWKINAFELWCWRKLLRVPWTARRSNQSVLKEISPEYSLEGLMLKLKLQYFGHLMLGKIEGRRGWQRMRWLDGITNSMDMSLSKLQEWWWTGKPGVLQSMGSERVRHNWVTELIVWFRERMLEIDPERHRFKTALGIGIIMPSKWVYWESGIWSEWCM